jgi:hypothetical protein
MPFVEENMVRTRNFFILVVDNIHDFEYIPTLVFRI